MEINRMWPFLDCLFVVVGILCLPLLVCLPQVLGRQGLPHAAPPAAPKATLPVLRLSAPVLQRSRRQIHGLHTGRGRDPSVPSALEVTSAFARSPTTNITPVAANVRTDVQQGQTRVRTTKPQLSQTWGNEGLTDLEPKEQRNVTFFRRSGEGGKKYGGDVDPTSETDDYYAEQALKYYYFGGGRARNSIPFVLLGPSIDHWKTVGYNLAARGFCAFACQRVAASGGDRYQLSRLGSSLIMDVMDSSSWQKVILVGCDEESALAAAAAMLLAPDRVAGLVLCGDVSSVESLFRDGEGHTVDTFLLQHVNCPSTIIWNGVTLPPKIGGEYLEKNRCLILGGGIAPHRRLPDLFAWELTRFVEERVAPHPDRKHPSRPKRKRRLLPRPLLEMFSPENFVGTGRLIANVIINITILRVALYQCCRGHKVWLITQSQVHAHLTQAQEWWKRFLVWLGRSAMTLLLFDNNSPDDAVDGGSRRDNDTDADGLQPSDFYEGLVTSPA